MSFDAMAKVWAMDIKPATNKLVLLALADAANAETGLCCPSVKYIARRTGLDRKCVMRAVARLEKDGLILVNRSTGSSHSYVLESSPQSGTGTQSGTSPQRGQGTGTQSGTGGVPKAVQGVSPNGDTNQYITSKEPIKRKAATKKTTLPDDFDVSESVKAWAAQKGFDRLPQHLEHFRDLAIAKAYRYADWDRAFMNAIRNNWARLPERVREESL